MSFLSGLLAAIVEKIFVRLVIFAKDGLIKWQEARKDKAEKAAYDKRVSDALNNYKKSITKEDQENAFKNLINSARRH